MVQWYIAAGRLTQSSVVQPGKYERGNQLSCDFLTDETCNLTQTTQLVETAAGDLGNMCLHRELSVQLDAKIANRLHWLDDVGADCQVQLTFWNFTEGVFYDSFVSCGLNK